jgi:HEPN domain-containing protein
MSVEKAKAWLRKAESDLLSADNNLGAAQIPFDVVCYHCQQATEKHLKALLVFLDVNPPRTHDLLALLQDIRIYLKLPIPAQVENCCIILNPYAVEIRYPDDGSNPTLEDSKEARQSAEIACTWVRALIMK